MNVFLRRHGIIVFGLLAFVVTAATAAFAQEAGEALGSVGAGKGISDSLIAQGPIGILALAALGWSVRLDVAARNERKDHEKAMQVKDEKLVAVQVEQAKQSAQNIILMERILRLLERLENRP